MSSSPPSVSIQSPFVCFGTITCNETKSTFVCPNHLILNVWDLKNSQRVSIQIAFKHIIKALFCHNGNQRGLALWVTDFCARRIRNAIQIPVVPSAEHENLARYFDPNSCRIYHRYILLNLSSCTSHDLFSLEAVLREVHQLKTLASLDTRLSVDASNASHRFIDVMSKEGYDNLLREIQQCYKMESKAPVVSNSSSASTPINRNLQTATILQAQPIFQNTYTIIHTNLAANVQRTSLPTNTVSPQQTVQSYLAIPVQVQGPSRRSTLLHQTRNPLSKNIRRQHETLLVNRVAVINKSHIASISLSQPSNLPKAEALASTSSKRIVHLIDEEDSDSVRSKKFRLDLLLEYPREAKNAIPIHFADLNYLKPNEMLNDTIIEFYLKYIQNEVVPADRRSSIFIFNSFFYTRLTQCSASGNPLESTQSRTQLVMQNYKMVRTWTKNVNLFDFEYIVIPIIEDIHWYMAIITFPKYAIEYNFNDSSQSNSSLLTRSHIVVLDSLIDEYDRKRKHTVEILMNYMECEYNEKIKPKEKNDSNFNRSRVIKVVPHPVPQQRNHTDCGLFLLKFAECFLSKPPLFITPYDSFRRWYPNFTLREMRTMILRKLKELCAVETWNAYEKSKGRRKLEGDITVDDAKESETMEAESRAPSLRRRSLSVGDNIFKQSRSIRAQSHPRSNN